MGMTITRFEKTIIPQTVEGWKYADDYEKVLRAQGTFRGRAEDTNAIIINAEYCLVFPEVKNG